MRLQSRRVVHGRGPAELRVGPGWVDIENDVIVAVGEGTPDDARVADHDFGDALIAPAFVNAHTHVSLASLRGAIGGATEGNVVEDLFYAFESRQSADDVRAFARMGAYESLLCGVGLVWDHYFFGEAMAQAFEDVGLAAVVGPTLQDLSGPGTPQWEAQLEATESIANAKRTGIYAAVAPHATDTVSDDLWKRACELAERLSLPIHAHLAQSPEEYRRALERHDATPFGMLEKLGVIEQGGGVFVHCLYLHEDELATVGDNTLVACPYAQLQFGFPARVDHWQRAGAKWTVATDCSASNDSFSIRKELRFVAGQRTQATPYGDAYDAFLGRRASAEEVWSERLAQYQFFDHQANHEALLHRVWNLAGTLHPGVKAGALYPGYLANVAVWDTSHPAFWPASAPLSTLAYGDVDGALHAMFVAGRTIGEPGRLRETLLGERYEEHRREASERLAALRRAR